ncbi:MAG: hypothetical protein AAGI88_20890 [Pseudomonadota bacterium]
MRIGKTWTYTGKIPLIAGSIGVFVFSIAPFTPAVLAAPLLMLLGAALFRSRAKKTAIVIVYWSTCACLVSPMNRIVPFDSAVLVLPTLLAGLMLMTYLAIRRVKAQSSPDRSIRQMQ